MNCRGGACDMYRFFFAVFIGGITIHSHPNDMI